MTDTQIIIDEIDVTSCIYACHKLNKDGLHACRIPNTAPFCCENIHNCYYKNWQRKEQECDELAYENYELNELFDRLKAENEELKKNYFTVIQQRNKAEQTLTEIKEILLFNKQELEECLHNDIDGQILQKISEVKNGN